MATYEVGEVVQFVRQVTRTNPDRIINVDEKAHIAAVAPDGSYTVKLLSGDSESGITDADIEPSADLPGDSVPTDSQEHPMSTNARMTPPNTNTSGES
jgi:hypothetical protein